MRNQVKGRSFRGAVRPTVLGVVALLVATLLGFGLGTRFSSHSGGGSVGLESVAHADKAGTSGESGLLKKSSESFRAVVRKVGPAVVTIKSTIGATPRHGRLHGRRMQPPPDEDEGQGAPFEDPFFDFFRRFGGPGFGFPQPEQAPQTSLGSGIIIDKRGYIVTNNHVVKGANKVVVNLPSQESVDIPAKVVGTDPRSDLAVLKIDERKDLPSADWADSDAVEVGDWAIAIGSPFMLSHTVTAGIVSAKGRNSSLLGSQYGYDMLQTDAAINPGNSGGPLCTIDGQVMGVNTAIYTRSGGYMGIGFAIPSNLARNIVDTLIKGGKVVRGWLGVTIQPVDEATARDLGVAGGALVHSVEPGSPAAKAGLRPGDVILEVGGKGVKETSQVQQMVSNSKPGSKVSLKVINYNDRKARTVTVTIGELPSNPRHGEEPGGGRQNGPDPLGLSVSPASGGVRIDDVEQGSLGDQVGLQRGDKIVSINRKPIKSVDAYEKAVKGAKNLNLLVNRQGQEIFIQLTLP